MKSLILTLALMLPPTLLTAQTIVPVRAIRSGSIISEADITSVSKTTNGAIQNAAAVIGKEAKVTLYPNRPIHQADIGAPAIIERNQIVKMMYKTGVLSISTDGRVLDRAGLGDRVRVMNMASRATVVGTVLANGTIEVGR